MRIRIVKPGVLSTVQDMGRKLHLAEAVPVSGVMDTYAARIANIALGNDSGLAVIELTYSSAIFIAETDIMIAYAGAGSVLTVNDEILPAAKPVFLPSGTQINQKVCEKGCRIYLAVAGGWNVPMVLGSRSTYLTAGFGGFQGRALLAGDIISSIDRLQVITNKILDELSGDAIKFPHWQVPPYAYQGERKTIRVVSGSECYRFTGESILSFFSKPYKVSSDSNRMGLNLTGASLNRLDTGEMLSTAVTSGTIQVTNSGTAVILMADCQTTGGYPRIAQVAVTDLPLCGQLVPGDELYFIQVTWHEAEMLYIEQEKHLQKAELALQYKYA